MKTILYNNNSFLLAIILAFGFTFSNESFAGKGGVKGPPGGSSSTLSAPVLSASEAGNAISISWSDAGDENGYELQRSVNSSSSFSTIFSGSKHDRSYSDSAVNGGNTYYYRVRATAKKNRVSDYSNTANVVIAGAADTTPPSSSVSMNEAASSSPSKSVSVSFSENVSGFSLNDINVSNGSAANFSGNGSSYSFTVTALANGSLSVSIPAGAATDAAGNSNTASNSRSFVFDNIAPSVPALSASSTENSISLSYPASSDSGVGNITYQIYKNSSLNTPIYQGSALSFTDTGLSASTTYSYQIRAYDGLGNVSALSSLLSVTTKDPSPAPDTLPPSIPNITSALPNGENQVDLIWLASFDESGGSGFSHYAIYRDGSLLVRSTMSTSYSDSDAGLAADTSYSYEIRAYDQAGNFASSPPASVTTDAPPAASSRLVFFPNAPADGSSPGCETQRLKVSVNGSILGIIDGDSCMEMPESMATSSTLEVRCTDDLGTHGNAPDSDPVGPATIGGDPNACSSNNTTVVAGG